MENEHKICTLEQAKQLAEFDIISSTDKYWIFDRVWTKYEELLDTKYRDDLTGYASNLDSGVSVEKYQAPNSDELSGVIPPNIDIGGKIYDLIFHKIADNVKDIYICDVVDKDDLFFDFKNDHLAWLMADVLIWLLKSKHIQPSITDFPIINEAETIEIIHRY